MEDIDSGATPRQKQSLIEKLLSQVRRQADLLWGKSRNSWIGIDSTIPSATESRALDFFSGNAANEMAKGINQLRSPSNTARFQ
jgi:hypothetical protein